MMVDYVGKFNILRVLNRIVGDSAVNKKATIIVFLVILSLSMFHSVLAEAANASLTEAANFSVYDRGEMVSISGVLTFDQASVANIIVSVIVFYPNGSQMLTFAGLTDAEGMYATQFRISYDPNTPTGNYTALASSSVSQIEVSSSVNFFVANATIDDFNLDGSVNFADIRYFENAYIQFFQNNAYDPVCDLNQDGKINFQDIKLLVFYYVSYYLYPVNQTDN